MPQIDGDGEVGSWIMLDDAGAGPRRGERFAANGTQTGSHRSLGEAMVDEVSAVFEGEAFDEGKRHRAVKSPGCQADRLVGGRNGWMTGVTSCMVVNSWLAGIGRRS